MTTMQTSAEVFRLMSVIAEDEGLMKRMLKYMRGLVAKKEDPTLITKEEFEAKIERAHQQMRDGRTTKMLPGETMDELLRRKGYHLHDLLYA